MDPFNNSVHRVIQFSRIKYESLRKELVNSLHQSTEHKYQGKYKYPWNISLYKITHQNLTNYISLNFYLNVSQLISLLSWLNVIG